MSTITLYHGTTLENGDTDDLIQESLDAGSVFVDADVSVSVSCKKIKTFIDYEEVV